MNVKFNTRLCGTIGILFFVGACADPVTSIGPSSDFESASGKRAAVTTSDRSEAFPTAFDNPCNGEAVVGTATYHLLTSFNNTPNGVAYKFTMNLKYDGLGSFGNKYQGQTSLSDEGKISYAGSFAVGSDVNLKLVSQGKAPNFTSRFKMSFKIDATGSVTNNSQRISESCS